MAQTLEYSLTIAAPAAEVFRAFTRSTPLHDWLCDMALADARPGGRIYLWWNRGYYAAGEFTALEPGRRITFTWMGRSEPGQTEVDVQLQPSGSCTEVLLAHTGLGEGEAWERVRAEFDRGWTAALQNLESLLETGQDLRYTQRPMLGVLLDEFNPAVAAELGVPVAEGVRITNAMPGLAAADAGLQPNDVLVVVDGQPVVDYPSLVSALQDRRAGETLDIGYYRGSQYRAGRLTLSARWLPEVPIAPGELAAALPGINEGLLARLRETVAGASDEQARAKPDDHNWNVLEVIAHLVASERENHAWLSDLINDDERISDRYSNSTSVPARVDALAVIHPTLDSMLRTIEEALRETEAMVARLPDEVVRHRDSYWRIGDTLLQSDQHWHEHFDQIRDALAQATA
jgi:uncharacterized protein YndB with AHSA1/START domain